MGPLFVLLALIVAGALGYILGRRRVSPASKPVVREEPKTSTPPADAAPVPPQADPSPVAPAPTNRHEGTTQNRPHVQAPATAAPATPAPAPAAESHRKPYDSPIAIKRITTSHGSIQCSYSDLATNTEGFLTLLRDEGFELADFGATELHDRYEDFDAYSHSSFDEALREQRWKSVYGAWKLSGSYDGAEILVNECHPGDLDEGIIVRFAEPDASRVEPLLATIERAFVPDLFLMDGSEVVSYRGTRDCVTIPSEYPNACKTIGESVFEGNASLTRIVIPPCVTRIERRAFKGCKNLEAITLQQEVRQTFSRTKKKLVSFPVNNPVDIGYRAFEGCTSLKSLRLHPGVKSLGSCAFFGCSSLERLFLSDSLESIGDQAFQGCDLLRTAGPADSNATYDIQLGFKTQIPDKLFQYLKGLRRVVVPEGVKRLGKESFYYCDNLEEIVLPSSLEVIDDEAIGFCSKLRNLNIPAGASIEGSLLRGCDALADEDGFIIHDNVVYDYIGHRVHVSIPDGITRIADRAFAYRPRPGINSGDIVSVVIPDSVVHIGRSAFHRCSKLVDVTMPESASVASCAFNGCTSLRKKDEPSAEPKSPKDATWTWEMEPLKLAINNSDATSEDTKLVRSYKATHLAGGSEKRPGKLVLWNTGFSFTATTDKQGRPSVKGSWGQRSDPFDRSDRVLTIRSTNGLHRFELSPSDLDEIEFVGLEREESSRRTSDFASSIADSCSGHPWPSINHPFFERHGSATTDVAGLFKFIGWSFLTEPLPWATHSIAIEHSRHKLRVTAKQGASDYVYYESPVEIRVSFTSESVGFFDDSEHNEHYSCTLRYVENPTKEMSSQAKSVEEVASNATECYLRDPFGMQGIFHVTRVR